MSAEFGDLPQPEHDGLVPVDSLDTDGDNPNEMTDEQFGLLCERMRDNGWLGGPIITNADGLIADGEHRWRAAQEIGLEEVPVQQHDIDEATRRLWRQELNKIHGEHDTKRDALEYDYLLDAGKTDEVQSLTDAADEDLDELLAEIKMESSTPAEYEYDPDHNVYFEDCVKGMADRLDDNSVDCVITDPPYGIDVSGDHGGDIEGDTTISEAKKLLLKSSKEVSRVLKPDGHAYFFWTAKNIPAGISVLEGGFVDVQVMIWTKNRSNVRATLQNHKYPYNYEIIFYATNDNPRALNGRPTSNKDVIESNIVHTDDLQHRTQKPVGLISQLINNSTTEGDRILDPFMGSGTTAVAAIQNDRDYIGFELDGDNYRDVIERRIGEAKRQREATVNTEE
jgi:DNA modification methylase